MLFEPIFLTLYTLKAPWKLPNLNFVEGQRESSSRPTRTHARHFIVYRDSLGTIHLRRPHNDTQADV